VPRLLRVGAATATLIAVAMHLSHGTLYPAQAQPAAAIAAASGSPACDHQRFRAVVDVGHTAGKPGAKSARGADEYDFNLRLAKEIAQKLTDAGFERTVLLITAEAPRAGLFKRAARANAMPADLFLAIHHDSVPDSFLEKWQYEGAEHTFSDRFPGHSIFISFDNPQRDRSLAFGKLLGDQLKARGLKYAPHYTEKFMGHRRRVLVDAEAGVYRYDQLVVLRATRMPAVLLEAGSIINRDEELELGTPERRSLTSDAVVAAVESFCALRPSPSRDLLAHPAHAQHTVRPAATAPTGKTIRRP
jgi:N-acetylmuramoyl-L-alanine amidase